MTPSIPVKVEDLRKIQECLVHYASLPPFEDGKVRLKIGCGKALEGLEVLSRYVKEGEK